MTGALRALLGRASGWSISPRTLFATTGSLVGTMIVTSGLGAAFWWVAARLFDAASVGVAGAMTAAMQILAVVGVPGIGTLLVRELPRHAGREPALLGTAVTATGIITAIIGAVAAVVLPIIDPDVAILRSGPFPVALFSVGVMLSGIGVVADLALLGLDRAQLQFLRNAVFSVVKLAALVPAAFVVASSGLVIFAMWTVGAAVSLGLLATVATRRGFSLRPTLHMQLLRGLGPSALAHYALNLALQVPVLGMPVLVAAGTGAIATGQFYVAWLVASMAFYVPLALSQTLYAIGARSPHELGNHVRQTVVLSLIAALGATVAMAVLGEPVLLLFGSTYAEIADLLPVFAAGSVALVFKDHYHVVYRIQERTRTAAVVCGIGGFAEVVAALVGLAVGGLAGLAWVWLAVLGIEGLLMGIAMWRATARLERPPGA